MADRKLDEKTLKNRQINYSIFKMLWQLRPDKKKLDEFYKKDEIGIGIDRNRYSVILSRKVGRTPRLGEDAERLSKQTGVNKDIFLGNRDLRVQGITSDIWDEYCKDLKDSWDQKLPDGVKRKARRKCSDKEKEIKRKLIETPYTSGVDLDLLSAFLYFVEGKQFNGSKVQLDLERLMNLMQSMGFTQLDSIEAEALERYVVFLKSQYQMASTIISYKDFKKKS